MKRFLVIFTLINSVLAGFLYLDYRNRMSSNVTTADLPKTAIVFTGQYDRIDDGLQLLGEHAIDQLFISGVNAISGLYAATFDDQFHLSPELRAAREAGRIVLASDADNTLENGVETACWLAGRPRIGTVALITSHCHMPRASLALERAVPRGVGVERLDVADPTFADAQACSALDFAKFAATWAITLLPDRFWHTDTIHTCVSSPAGGGG